MFGSRPVALRAAHCLPKRPGDGGSFQSKSSEAECLRPAPGLTWSPTTGWGRQPLCPLLQVPWEPGWSFRPRGRAPQHSHQTWPGCQATGWGPALALSQPWACPRLRHLSGPLPHCRALGSELCWSVLSTALSARALSGSLSPSAKAEPCCASALPTRSTHTG